MNTLRLKTSLQIAQVHVFIIYVDMRRVWKDAQKNKIRAVVMHLRSEHEKRRLINSIRH
jgi:hypothetical protein